MRDRRGRAWARVSPEGTFFLVPGRPTIRPAGCAAGRILLVGLVALAGASGGACRRGASPSRPPPAAPALPVLGPVEVRDESREHPGPGPLDVDAIAAALRTTLGRSGLVRIAPPDAAAAIGDAPVLHVLGEVAVEAVEAEKKGLIRANVSLQLVTRPVESLGAINESLSAGGEQIYALGGGGDRGRLAQKLAERTATDLLGGFVARARLATAPAAEVHQAIVADGGVLREEAIRVAGARQLREEVPSLLALLQDDEESVRDAALGALIAMRERRAVAELTRNRSLRDRREMRKILDAIAILGGDEARDYLSFVAESHDDEEIRRLATEAQGRLRRRERDAAAR